MPEGSGSADAAVNQAAWSSIAALDPPQRRPPVAAIRVEWTARPGQGPGVELLGDLTGADVIELGCGTGDHLAHIATRRPRSAHGVDLAEARVEQARTRWGRLPITWHVGDAATVLDQLPLRFDVCYSIFGALWYADPVVLLPSIRARLRPGGLLAFSGNTPRPGELSGRRVDNLTLANGGRLPAIHYAHTQPEWENLLRAHGFQPRRIESHPLEEHHTLIITAS